MSFQFPASPSIGQIFIGDNGAQYVWNGTVWNQVSGNPATLTAQARNRIVNPAIQISQENDVTGSPTTLLVRCRPVALQYSDKWRNPAFDAFR